VLFLIDGASFLFAATESLIPNPQSIRNHQSIPNPQSIRNPQSTIRNVGCAALVASFASLAVALAVLGQIRSREAALAILFVTGALSGMINVLVLSIIQRQTSEAFRGRVLACTR
jgi:hypothetical protein